jgi:hypothetical protein
MDHELAQRILFIKLGFSEKLGILSNQKDIATLQEILSRATFVKIEEYSNPQTKIMDHVEYTCFDGTPYSQAHTMISLLGENIDIDPLIKQLIVDHKSNMKKQILEEFPNAAEYFKN